MKRQRQLKGYSMSRKTEFELPGKLSIGQYIPTGSVMHRLDPRVKLLMGIFLIGAAVGSRSLVSLVMLFTAVTGGLVLTRVEIRIAFSALQPMIPFLFLLALLQVFAVPQLRVDASIIWQRRFLTLTDRSLVAGILLICRFIVIVLGLSLFSFCTTTAELVHGIEHMLRPLQKLKFPAHELALVVNISLRFLPILACETERLMKAQASRGADFGYGKRIYFIRRIRKLFPLFIPLFTQSLKHAYNLVEAMESRCYTGGKGRTYLTHLHAKSTDYIALVLSVVIITALILMNIMHIDRIFWEYLHKLLLQ